MQVVPTPCFERYLGQLHDALPSLHDGTDSASAQQRPSFRIGVLGAAIVNTKDVEWDTSLHHDRLKNLSEGGTK